MHDIDTLIQELVAADPSLKGREPALRELLAELLAGKPDAALDPAFKARLKHQLAAAGAMHRPRLAPGHRMRLYYGVGAMALLVVLLVAAKPGTPSAPPQVAFKAADEGIAGDAPAEPEAGDTMMMTGARQANTMMQLTSTVFSEGEPIPAQYTCDGDSVVPPLGWSGVPEGTVSLALVLHDPDAPREGGFTHWVVYDIPANAAGVQGTDGANGTGKTGYVGPCPPSGVHHYVFTLYALDAMLGLKEGVDETGFLEAAQGHTLATAQLVGTYQRK